MKFFTLIAVVGFLVTTQVNAQKYERIYESAGTDVRDRIDYNKMTAAPMLSGVQTHHVAGISGLNAAQVASFKNDLSAQPGIVSVTVSPDGTSLVVDSKADFAREELQQVLAHYNATVIAYTATYSLSEE